MDLITRQVRGQCAGSLTSLQRRIGHLFQVHRNRPEVPLYAITLVKENLGLTKWPVNQVVQARLPLFRAFQLCRHRDWASLAKSWSSDPAVLAQQVQKKLLVPGQRGWPHQSPRVEPYLGWIAREVKRILDHPKRRLSVQELFDWQTSFGFGEKGYPTEAEGMSGRDLEQLASLLQNILDWAYQQHPNLNDFTWEQAAAAAEDWHAALAGLPTRAMQRAERRVERATRRVRQQDLVHAISQAELRAQRIREEEERLRAAEAARQTEARRQAALANPLPPQGRVWTLPTGWTVRELVTREELDWEGLVQRHCAHTYWGDLTAGTSQFFSIRDETGAPRILVQALVCQGAEGQKLQVLQAKGYLNHPVGISNEERSLVDGFDPEGIQAQIDQGHVKPDWIEIASVRQACALLRLGWDSARLDTCMLNTRLRPREEKGSGQRAAGLRVSVEKLLAAAKDAFGLTPHLEFAGFILPDGSMLDFGGEGFTASRARDHREIAFIHSGLPAGTQGMEAFMRRTGAIRVGYSGPMRGIPAYMWLHMLVLPTEAQVSQVCRSIRDYQISSVEIIGGKDRTSIQAPSTREVIQAIENLFSSSSSSRGGRRACAACWLLGLLAVLPP